MGRVILLVVALICTLSAASRHRLKRSVSSSSKASTAVSGDQFEQMLQNLPDPDRLRQNLFDLTRYPHVFGVANVVPQMTSHMNAALAKIPNATVHVHSFTGIETRDSFELGSEFMIFPPPPFFFSSSLHSACRASCQSEGLFCW